MWISDAKRARDRFVRLFRLAPDVREHDHLRPGFGKKPQCLRGLFDAEHIGDISALIKRNIESGTHENAFAFELGCRYVGNIFHASLQIFDRSNECR
jgi:hypothetical protein